MSAVNFFAIAEKLLDHRNDLRAFILVPLTGLEPVRVLPRGILSPFGIFNKTAQIRGFNAVIIIKVCKSV